MRLVPRCRWIYLVLAYACVGVGAVGVVLPGLPTTPFLLLAVWAAGRGSLRLHQWLYEHPRFGLALRAWEREGAVPTGAKWAAVLLLTVSWITMVWFSPHPVVLAVSGLLFIGVAVFLLTRPSPTPDC